jgi:predicted HTH domain antitoxin
MQITLDLPDDIAQQLAPGRDLARAALEALVLEAIREHRLTEHQAASLLDLSRYELDGFLKQHEVWLDYSIEELQRERELGERLWKQRQAEGERGGE